MNQNILKIIQSFSIGHITEERKIALQPFAEYIQSKTDCGETIRLNFICTHNSRRSHLSQIWAQAMAYYFGLKNVFCYSGGTEATAMFSKVAETLSSQGFEIQKLSEDDNPVYAVKYSENESPVICFSKVYDDNFNPNNKFAAIMTCNNADEGCPLVIGAEARFPVKYDDPKVSDNTPEQNRVYAERSLQIGEEMFFIFSQIKK